MKKMMNARLAAATASCVAMLLATGCVSKQEFTKVTGERDQVLLDLTQTRSQRDEANQASERLTRDLAAARTESDGHARRAAEIAATLSQNEAALTSTHGELKTTRDHLEAARGELKTTQGSLARAEREVGVTRDKLVKAEKRAAQIAVDLEESRSAFANLQNESRARAEEAAAQLGDAKAALAVAR
jgi:chromosome segregation ATPase